MSNHMIYGTHVKDIANKERLANAFTIQKQKKMPAFYILPSHKWLQAARQRQPGLLVTTFDDIADYLLKQAGHSYISITEQERSLFFQQFMREEGVFEEEVHYGKAEGYADTYGQVKRLGLALDELPSSLTPLYSLFEKYEERVLLERNLLDPEHLILRAISVLKEMTDQVPVSLVTIDGYYDFSPLQALFVESLQKAGVHVDIYVPNHEHFEIIHGTVSELVQMGFVDRRDSCIDSVHSVKKEIVAATTTDEQWRGVMEDIRQSEYAPSEVGVVVVDERKGMKELDHFSAMYDIPLNAAKKRPISSTSIHSFLLYALKQTGGKQTKWEQLPLAEHVLKLYQVSGLAYAKQKKSFLHTGQWLQPEHEQLYEQLRHLSWEKNESFVHYLVKLEGWMKELPIVAYWESCFELESNVGKLKEAADEYKAFNKLLALIEQYRKQLIEKGLTEFRLPIDLFTDWIRELGERTELFVQRASKSGLAVHTWRDVGLFRGKKLYVVGMNEGIFPSPNHLSGYVQERDLIDSKVRYSPPTQLHVRQKQEAHYLQLEYIAEEITFTYVTGVDSDHPLLRSPFLEEINVEERTWSWEERIQKGFAFTEQDLEEKIAFHLGKGSEIDQVPLKLATVSNRIQRLVEGDEQVVLIDENKKSTISVTALENYARCPFRYAMERVIGASEPEAKDEQVSPLDIGQFIHEIIYETYTKLHLIGVPFGKATEEMLSQVPTMFHHLFEEKWITVEQQCLDMPRFDLILTKKKWLSRLEKWWQAERKHFWDNKQLADMSIMALEKSIQLEYRLESGENLLLTGKIDRIDSSNRSFAIYDYKTGKASVKMEDVQAGLKLQLPFYSLAVNEEAAKRSGSGLTADGATYISMLEPNKRAGNGIWRNEHIGKGSIYSVTSHCKNREDTLGTEEFLQKYELKERIEQIWTGMHTNFPVKPLDCANHCPYRSVCRVTDEQKEQTPLNE
ncbi:hypothetical protein GN156_02995 [bacterium LRH843]|nr:hypothetical protein [bacterium LRH843]